MQGQREATVHQEVSVLIYGRSNVAVVFFFFFSQNDKYKLKKNPFLHGCLYSVLLLVDFKITDLKSTVTGVFEEINAAE